MSVVWNFYSSTSTFEGVERIADTKPKETGKDKSGQTANSDKEAQGESAQAENKPEGKVVYTIYASRVKDTETSMVSVVLDGWHGKEDCGKIVAYADTLESDLKKFLRFGLVLKNSEIIDLKQIIIDNFYNIGWGEDIDQNDTRLKSLFAAIKKYVDGDAALLNGNELFIPTTDFDGLALDCGYKTYEIGQLRKFLRDNDYSIAPEGRTSRLARIKNKTTRVVSFDKDKVLSGGEEKKA